MRRFLFAALLLPAVAWAAESPFTGTWRIDLTKVQFSGDAMVWVLQDGRYRCSTCVPPTDIKADGADQAVSGSKHFDTLAVTVLDDKTVEFTRKKGGRIVDKEKRTLSADGNTLTVDYTGYSENSNEPIAVKESLARNAPAPPGSHSVSGAWRTSKVDAASENAMTITYKASDDGLTMLGPTGESYEARFDGKDYPVKGDPSGDVVSLEKVDDRTIEETTKRDGKVVYVTVMTVSPDGKTLTAKTEDKERGTINTWVAVKQ